MKTSSPSTARICFEVKWLKDMITLFTVSETSSEPTASPSMPTDSSSFPWGQVSCFSRLEKEMKGRASMTQLQKAGSVIEALKVIVQASFMDSADAWCKRWFNREFVTTDVRVYGSS